MTYKDPTLILEITFIPNYPLTRCEFYHFCTLGLINYLFGFVSLDVKPILGAVKTAGDQAIALSCSDTTHPSDIMVSEPLPSSLRSLTPKRRAAL